MSTIPAPQLRLLYITCPDEATATALAEMAIDRKLAACANILPGMRSVYRWEGKVEQADELVLILKTVEEMVPGLIAMVEEAHPYDLPAILSLPAETTRGFHGWVTGEIAG